MAKGKVLVQEVGAIARPAVNGDGIHANPLITTIATDAALTLTAAQIAGGMVIFSSFSAGRVVTTDTAANIIAAFPNLEIGDTAIIIVSAQAAFAATWAAGTDVTLAGRATTPASSYSIVAITRTGAATVTWTVM